MPGSDPRVAYGNLVGRGVRGIILESFGVGNMPDTPEHGWLPWLKDQRKKGLQVLCLGPWGEVYDADGFCGDDEHISWDIGRVREREMDRGVTDLT